MKIGFFTDRITRHNARLLAAPTFALLACLTACTKDSAPAGKTTVSLTLEADGGLRPASRAAANDSGLDETAVTDMWVLQYDMSSATGSLVARQHTTQIYQSGSKVRLDVELLPLDRTRIVVFANSPTDFSESFLADGTSLSALDQKTLPVTTPTGNPFPQEYSYTLPMRGQSATVKLEEGQPSTLSASLTRLAAKFSLTLENRTTDSYPRLTLQSVGVYNAPNILSCAPVTAATHASVRFPQASASYFKNYTPVTTGIGDPSVELTWYFAPNSRGTGSATTPADKTAQTAPSGQSSYCTYILIDGSVQNAENGNSTPVTYTIYLGGNNTNDYNLWSNESYRANVVFSAPNTRHAAQTASTQGVTWRYTLEKTDDRQHTEPK